PGHGAELRAFCHELVESPGPADDLRRLARMARTAGEPVVVLGGDVVAHRDALAAVVANHKVATGAAVAVGPEGPGDAALAPRVRSERGRLVSAGSPFHRVTLPTHTFRGVLRVATEDLEAFADAAERLATLVEKAEHRDGLPGAPTLVGDEAEPVDVLGLLLVGLIRSGVTVSSCDIRVLHCARVRDRIDVQAAVGALRAVDEDAVRLAAAVKSNDGFFTTYFVSSYSPYLVHFAAKLGLTPNTVSWISMGFGVLAAVWFAEGDRLGLVLGGLILYLAFVLDCVDGQLARYTRRFSALGAWLDATFDRGKEYVAYVGLAIGAGVSGVGDVWPLAVAAMILQSVRHMIDFSYSATMTTVLQRLPRRSLDDPDDGLAAHVVTAPAEAEADTELGVAGKGAAVGGAVARVSRRFEGVTALRWLKKIIVLPIGERFALIALTAAIWNAEVTFISLLAWGGVAACYTLTGRVLRSLAR
ncbi:MAG: CDP-alcohol phosphatidyltransferase family protein, partial [Streptosporangiales bacterium]|nr:CDP-alcohol phosphatidyltransferase family protein [Streptosporangiales bacterium]